MPAAGFARVTLDPKDNINEHKAINQAFRAGPRIKGQAFGFLYRTHICT